MRKVIGILLACAVAISAFGYLAVRAQGPGTSVAKKAAIELTESQGGSVWIIKQLIAQRPGFVRRVVHLTGLADEQASRVTDEVFIPELVSHEGEVEGAIQDAWAASFSAHDLHTLERCWLLLSHMDLAKIEDINRCEASHAARKLATEQAILNARTKAAGLTFGLKTFPAAFARYRDRLREEGIVVTEGVKL